MRVTANARALTPSAAGKPNVFSTMVMELLLQTYCFVFIACMALLVVMLQVRDRRSWNFRNVERNNIARMFCNCT
jgi:hypothetical protein